MIRNIEASKDALAVTWQKGSTSRFPFIWLRDNCRCAKCRDPRNGQRLFDTLDLPAEPKPAEARLDGDALTIRWAGEDHDSRYTGAWLSAHDLSPQARAQRPEQASPLGSRDRQRPAPGGLAGRSCRSCRRSCGF